MKIFTYEEFSRTISQEEMIVFVGYLHSDANKLDVNHWKNKFGDVFNVSHLLFVEHNSDDGVRPLEIEVLYNYQDNFMKVEVVQVIEYNNRYELDLLFKAQNLISEYVPESH